MGNDPYSTPPNHPPDHVAPEIPGPSAVVSLRPVTRENVRAVCDLRTRPEQRRLVGPAAYTVAESAYEPYGIVKAIYADEVLVGLGLVDDETSTPYMVRFLIDAAAQGRGFGAAAVERFCVELRDAGYTQLEVTFVPTPGGAEGFWAGLGFTDTGRIREGEPIYIRGL